MRLMTDATVFERRIDDPLGQQSRSADLLTGALGKWNAAQALAAIFGGVILPLAVLELPRLAVGLSIAAALLLVTAELIQRGLFFAAAVSPRMPGVSHQ
jgi:DMSO reductase anchor subunit